MKQISSIRLLLGVSQEDMAQLLQVNRSQLAMFETGKRDLPRAAKILLAPMLAQATQASLKQAPETAYPSTKMREYLKGLLQENELQRVKMARRLENTKALYQKNLAILNLTGFLSESATSRPAHFKQLVQTIKAKANDALTDCNPTLLMKYEIKSELLELEKLLLEEFTAKHTNDKASKKQEPSR
jgi:transcriptional regulator with XRE-family HTH domain